MPKNGSFKEVKESIVKQYIIEMYWDMANKMPSLSMKDIVFMMAEKMGIKDYMSLYRYIYKHRMEGKMNNQVDLTLAYKAKMEEAYASLADCKHKYEVAISVIEAIIPIIQKVAKNTQYIDGSRRDVMHAIDILKPQSNATIADKMVAFEIVESFVKNICNE